MCRRHFECTFVSLMMSFYVVSGEALGKVGSVCDGGKLVVIECFSESHRSIMARTTQCIKRMI